MKFGLFGVNSFAGAHPGAAAAVALLAEDIGLDSVWAVDHVVVPSTYQTPYPYDESGKMMGGQVEFDLADPLIWLTYAAALTERILLATGILILPQRNPLVLAKQVASLDVLSGGRVRLGVGVGWLEEEFTAVGVPFADRGRRHDDYVAALRALWTDTKASVDTRYARFTDVISLPHPTHGSVPIVIGGGSTRAAQRAGNLGDGFFPTVEGPEALKALLQVMTAEANAAQRDPSTIEVTIPYVGDPTGLETLDQNKRQQAFDRLCRAADAYGSLGVTRLLIPVLAEEALRGLAAMLAIRYGTNGYVIGG
ncbi:LLM class F420-dependent oxidoreductase [Mycolicibacterium sp. 120266]|uniref:LLM class F420-dependent oxidoreductase n=1 Tax=Mycolicibacterium sp. 120266 TaxID=3090601 RepID=UPI00299D79A4|nr:LLM class F420-dependent oxidoreductase [Mycolicibacterium sp. 120266]MDX1873267.1 LLM class F420-dependent oxidoreductase [Mycolicibacterium sp. 120266]